MAFLEAKVITDREGFPLDKQSYLFRREHNIFYKTRHAYVCTGCYKYAWYTDQRYHPHMTLRCPSCGQVASGERIYTSQPYEHDFFVWDIFEETGTGAYAKLPEV